MATELEILVVENIVRRWSRRGNNVGIGGSFGQPTPMSVMGFITNGCGCGINPLPKGDVRGVADYFFDLSVLRSLLQQSFR
jgi:hypothetical protein